MIESVETCINRLLLPFTQKGWKVHISKLILPTNEKGLNMYTLKLFFPNKQKCWNTFKLWLVSLSLRRAERCTHPSYFYPLRVKYIHIQTVFFPISRSVETLSNSDLFLFHSEGLKGVHIQVTFTHWGWNIYIFKLFFSQ
jgi:hypothetical protein